MILVAARDGHAASSVDVLTPTMRARRLSPGSLRGNAQLDIGGVRGGVHHGSFLDVQDDGDVERLRGASRRLGDGHVAADGGDAGGVQVAGDLQNRLAVAEGEVPDRSSVGVAVEDDAWALRVIGGRVVGFEDVMDTEVPAPAAAALSTNSYHVVM